MTPQAKAVTALYASPAALVNAYERTSDKEGMLADVAVGARRLGPALSKKICQAFLGSVI